MKYRPLVRLVAEEVGQNVGKKLRLQVCITSKELCVCEVGLLLIRLLESGMELSE